MLDQGRERDPRNAARTAICRANGNLDRKNDGSGKNEVVTRGSAFLCCEKRQESGTFTHCDLRDKVSGSSLIPRVRSGYMYSKVTKCFLECIHTHRLIDDTNKAKITK